MQPLAEKPEKLQFVYFIFVTAEGFCKLSYVTQQTISSTCQKCLYVLISYNLYASNETVLSEQQSASDPFWFRSQ